MFRSHAVPRIASTLAVVLAALTQACSDAASPKSSSPTVEDAHASAVASATAATVATKECATPQSTWIFCDDFETNRLTKYFEYDNAGGKFVRASGTGMGGSVGMRATFTKGASPAGRLSLAFGKTPDPYFKAVDAGVANYREVYWRFYVLRKAGWVGNGSGGLTRATIFAGSNWSQAIVAAGGTDDTDTRYLRIDPLSGTDASGNLKTTKFNDVANLRALGTARSAATEDDQAHAGQWACYEFHIKLNDAGQSNGVYELSVNGQLSAQKTGLNWVGAYNTDGINSLNLEQSGPAAPAANVRILDNFVVSTTPIGCGTTTAPGPVATITVAIDSSSLTVPHQAQATATMRDANGVIVPGTPTWTSEHPAAATVSSSGVVTAVAAGQAYIDATSGGVVGHGLITVTAAAPAPVAAVSVSLAASSITAGTTTQATATTMDANGNTLTGRTITWSSSNTAVATVSSSGLVMGVAAGSANIIATSEGKTGQAPITIVAATVPVASVSVSLAASSIAPNATTQATATTRDANNNVLTGRAVTWSSSNTAIATVSTSGLVTAKAAGSANIIATSEGKTGQATLTVTSGTNPPPTVLFEEKFEDTNFAGRGWYDIYSGGLTSLSTDHIPGSTHSLQVNFVAGQTGASPSTSGRHLFTPSNSVYLRYWVKYSTNWIGSGQTFHPHEFHFLTTEDNDYAGLASDALTMYIEQSYQSGGGLASLGAQDSRNIDVTRINQDLTNVTENRAVSGCNGNPEPGVTGDCYQSGGAYFNGRTWRSASPVFLPNPGPGYKADWHKVEVYFQLNSIVAGKAQPDGIAQYSIDGQMVIDRRNVYFRTAARPNMNFNQFIIAPYFGNGSPINLNIWYDALIVQTARPTP
jgi:uncharacterized protein YjdB